MFREVTRLGRQRRRDRSILYHRLRLLSSVIKGTELESYLWNSHRFQVRCVSRCFLLCSTVTRVSFTPGALLWRGFWRLGLRSWRRPANSNILGVNVWTAVGSRSWKWAMSIWQNNAGSGGSAYAHDTNQQTVIFGVFGWGVCVSIPRMMLNDVEFIIITVTSIYIC